MTAELYISHNQFFIYDKIYQKSAFQYTEKRPELGYDRNLYSVSIYTLINFGRSIFTVLLNETQSIEYDKWIETRIQIESGEVIIESPDHLDAINLTIPPGYYRLTVGQRELAEDREDVLVRFENIEP